MKQNYYRHIIFICLVATIPLFIGACKSNKEGNQPLSGLNWGEIQNSSAENVQSTIVSGWTPQQDRESAMHFYSSEAYDGTKSLTIQSEKPAYGLWSTKVNVKPWSKYKFSGWIKTEDIQNSNGRGAGFSFGVMSVDYKGHIGTNDWIEVSTVFETGNNDSFVLECFFNRGGKGTGKVWFDNMDLELISTDDFSTAIVIDAANEKEPMPEYIYGQFIEHMGKCIYGGIWAEMLDDRKFWYAPGETMSPWKIEGDKAQVQLEKHNSYTGEQTPILVSNSISSISLKQVGLGLKEGVKYSGRAVLKSSGNIKGVNISLLDEKGEVIDEMVISNLKDTYQKHPISFNSGLFTHNASLQITPNGSGKVWIGTISLMPDDNIEGFRADVIELLKGLRSPVYRWPGGNFVSGYDWKDGIGNRDQRPPRKNPAWTGVEHNDVGIHEFMILCELLDTEPFIAVNAGLAEAEEARKQVEYCNGGIDTPMGKWRGENGRSEPWNVKWWSVGNEMYGDWQLGHMSTDSFVGKHAEFANAMRSVDSDIKLVAVGDPGKWNEMMLSNNSDNMDLISEHFYRQDWHGGGLMSHVKQIPEAIADRAELHRKYRTEIPELKDKDIRIAMDEWNYWYGPHVYGELGTRYYLRDALGIAAGINEFSKNSDIIFMANYAQTVNVIGCIKTNTTHSVYASTGLALKMFRDHFGTIPLHISGETRPFDVAATLTADKKTLVVSIVNPTWETQRFDLDIDNAEIGSDVELYTLTGPDDMSFNVPGREESVVISGPEFQKVSNSYEVKPFSSSLFRFTIK